MSLWTPSAISTALWLDASDSSTLFDAVSGGSTPANNGAIARWQDKSGNGRHVTQATSTSRPIRIAAGENSLDVVSFDGSNDFFENTAAAMLRNVTGYSWFFAAKSQTVHNQEQTLAQVSTSAANSRFIAVKTVTNGFARLGGRRLSSQSFQGIDGTNHINQSAIWSAIVNHSTTSLDGLINGQSFATSSSFQNTGSTENDAGALYIGSNRGDGGFFNGTIFEIVAIHSAVSVVDRQTIEGYLAWKWGTQASLPSDHPFRNGAPTTGAQRRVINDGLFNRGLFGRSLVR